MDIDITGARILISRPEWGGFMLTETVVVTWVVMLILVLACRFMTAHLEVHPTKKRQVIAEWIVTSIRDMVQTNMGERYVHTWYVPFIGAMFALSAGCSLSSVVGAYAPTSDLSTVLGWALYGTRCCEFLFGVKAIRPYQILFLVVIFVGATMKLDLAWAIADTLNGLMAIPNLIALFALSGVVVKETKRHFSEVPSKK